LHETKSLQKIFTAMYRTMCRRRYVLFLILAFCAGCFAAGLLIFGQRSGISGNLDLRYARQHGRAAEIIGQLENELERERDINRQLREHNIRARELTEGVADAAERNVRNLQDAIVIIGEVRKKLQVLADFYSDSGPGDSGN